MKKILLAIFLLFVPAPPLLYLSIHAPISQKTLNPRALSSLKIVDRNGKLLREVLSDEEGPAQWDSFQEFPPFLIWATLAAEDKRFYSHHGLDFYAIARAAWVDLKSHQVISGASTISQQTVQNIFRFPRTPGYKIIQSWYALRLERTLNKNQILEQYLNRVPYGNQTFGAEAAARFYFGERASRLSLAKCAFLAGIPQSPTLNEPYKHFLKTREREKEILRTMLREEWIGLSDYHEALHEKIQMLRPEVVFKAPHFCNLIIAGIPKELRGKISVVRTTLDLEKQQMAEEILKNHLSRLSGKNVTNGSVVILDNRTGEVLAMVGSANFFNPSIDGEVNGALAVRSPGSTLKPVTYGAALEDGMTAATLLPDLETHIQVPGGDFTPKNYDENYHGPVRVRTALANSYNVPAVLVQQGVGTARLLGKLKECGFDDLKNNPDYYGPSLTLGDGGVTLLQLARLYRSLAAGGVLKREKLILAIEDPMGNLLQEITDRQIDHPKRIFSPQSAYIITRILSDNDARTPAFGSDSALKFPFPCAAKTGTSQNFQDNWTIGYTTKYTVAVWVGNFNSSPMHEVSGVTGAAPVFHDIMMELARKDPPDCFPVPSGIVKAKICSLSGMAAGHFCPDRMIEFFAKGTEPHDACSFHQRHGVRYPPEYLQWALTHDPLFARGSQSNSRITQIKIKFPLEGGVFKLDPVLPEKNQALCLEAVVPAEFSKVIWIIDGRPFKERSAPFELFWPLKPGRHMVQVMARSKKENINSSTVHFDVLQ